MKINMSNTKKYTVVIVLGLAIVVVGIFSFRSSSESTSTQLQGEQTASTTDWLTYHDSRYNFRIDYRPHLSVVREDQYIGFVDAEVEGPDHTGSSVFIEPTSFATPEEWVAQQNKDTDAQFANREQPMDLHLVPHWVIDNPITIDGQSGIVAHGTSDGYPLPPMVLFIKDGYLFTISDETADYQRTWDSFHFEE
jgi:hypothetical protein